MEGSYEACSEAAAWVLGRAAEPPRVALVCGSSYEACSEAAAWVLGRAAEPPRVALVCGSSYEACSEAAAWVLGRAAEPPRVALVCGSSYEACSEAAAWVLGRAAEPPRVALVCGSSYEACSEAAAWVLGRAAEPPRVALVCGSSYEACSEAAAWVLGRAAEPPRVALVCGSSYEACSEAAAWVLGRAAEPPRVALVCGSGLGALAQELAAPQHLDYGDIPHFPRSTVSGHAGRLVLGRLGATPCAVLQGRFHLYEGHSPGQVVLPVRVLRLLGAHTLVLTNAAGSLSPELGPGDLMVIKDHIDLPGLAGRGPLVGYNDERFGPRFPSMLDAYDPELRRLALAAAPPELRAREGVYVGVGGPSYETVAECRFLRRIGADAVGMSTVSEAVAARHCGLRVLGLSLITNAAPLPPEDGGPAPRDPPAGHQEVLEAAGAGARHLRALLARLVTRLDAAGDA